MNNLVGYTTYDIYVISLAALNVALAMSCLAVSVGLLCLALASLWQALPAGRVLNRQADRNSLPSFVDEN